MDKKIINFTIIAHVDHGKSTLADAILEACEAKMPHGAGAQFLDDLALERERGITIKSNCVNLKYKGVNLNLIDSPGHNDFNAEVRSSLAACENAVLVVDARSGVSARTVATFNQAKEAGLYIVPVINKIDVATEQQIDSCVIELANMGFDFDDILKISAKTRLGITDLLNAILVRCRSPEIVNGPLQALVLDCLFDKHLGVRLLVRVFAGSVSKADRLECNGCSFKVVDLLIKEPIWGKVNSIDCGEIGTIITQVKDTKTLYPGCTINLEGQLTDPILRISKPKPMVYCVWYAEDRNRTDVVAKSLEQYQLNDNAFVFEKENSAVYGLCFKCGFLGLLHMEIVYERLLREYDCELVRAMPNVRYKVQMKSGELREIYSAYDWPEHGDIGKVEEPMSNCVVSCMDEHVGSIYTALTERRAVNIQHNYQEGKNIILADIPLAEVIVGFPEVISSLTSGFGEFDYNLAEYSVCVADKLDILINAVSVPEFSIIVHELFAIAKARKLVDLLKELIPRAQVNIKIQACFRGKIVASSQISRYMSGVTDHCYGGDRTRRDKLLRNQAKGKERMQDLHGSSVASNIDVAKLVKMLNE